MDQNEREEKLAQVREQIAKLEEVNVDALSDEDLESVAGGFCSVWCCSQVQQQTEQVDQPS
jgi:hypothetical protein